MSAQDIVNELEERNNDLVDELESALADNDELATRLGELEDTVAELRGTVADLTSRLQEHSDQPYDETLSYGGTD